MLCDERQRQIRFALLERARWDVVAEMPQWQRPSKGPRPQHAALVQRGLAPSFYDQQPNAAASHQEMATRARHGHQHGDRSEAIQTHGFACSENAARKACWDVEKEQENAWPAGVDAAPIHEKHHEYTQNNNTLLQQQTCQGPFSLEKGLHHFSAPSHRQRKLSEAVCQAYSAREYAGESKSRSR